MPPRQTKPKAKPKTPAPRKSAADESVEHKIGVVSVGLMVNYGPARSEQLELRGKGLVSAGDGDGDEGQWTSGFVGIAPKRTAKDENRVGYTPASLDRNLIFTLYVDDKDFVFFRDLFIDKLADNAEGLDPGITFWARTPKPFDRTTPSTQPAIRFGYRVDFSLTSGGLR